MSYTARLIALALVLNTTMGGVVFKSLSDSHDEYGRDATVTTQNVSRLVAEELQGDFDLADAALRVLTDEIDLQTATGKKSPAIVENLIYRLLQRNPSLDNFRIIDRNGIAIGGPQGSTTPQPQSVADRPYFATLRDKPQVGLVVTESLKGKRSGKDVMVLARRLNDKSGAFDGVVLVVYDVDYLQRKLQAYTFGGGATIAVRSEQLTLIASYPPGTLTVSSIEATKIANAFSIALQKNPLLGTYTVGKDSIDGIPRLHSYTKSEKYPFYVNVGLARSDYLATWENEVQSMAAIYLLLC